MDVASFLAETRLKILHLHTITLRNKIFDDFGFAHFSISLEHLRIFIEIPDYVDTSIPTLILQATQPHLIFGATFKSSNLYTFRLHCFISLIARAHQTSKFLSKLINDTHRCNHLTTLYTLFYYCYLVLEPGATPPTSKRTWARQGKNIQRILAFEIRT